LEDSMSEETPETTAEAPAAEPDQEKPAEPAEITEEKPEAEPEEEVEELGGKYAKAIERLKAQARETRTQQEAAGADSELVEWAKKVRSAKDSGDPDAVLEAAGVVPRGSTPAKPEPFDIDEILGNKEKEPSYVVDMRKTVEALTERVEQLQGPVKKAEADRARAEQNKARDSVMGEITAHLEKESEKYQLTHGSKSAGDVFRSMVDLHGKGLQPTYDQAAELVEAHAEDLFVAMAGTGKGRELFTKVNAQQATGKQSKTLTNSLTSDSASPPDEWAETDEQNRARALAAAKQALEGAKTTE